MSNKDESWEKTLDTLLEGNLSKTEAEYLRKELDKDIGQAKDFIDTHQIQNGFDSPGIVKAPESLRKSIRQIPVHYKRVNQPLLRWRKFVPIALSVIVVVLIVYKPVSDEPTPDEINQAKKDLVIAFNYLYEVGQKTNFIMKREIADAMQDALIKGIFYGISKKPENG